MPGSLGLVWGWIPCGGSCLFCRVSPSTPLRCCPEVSSRHGAIWTKNTKRLSEDETSANSSTPQVEEMATQNRYQQCRRQFSWDQAKVCPTALPRNEPPPTAPLPLTCAKSTSGRGDTRVWRMPCFRVSKLHQIRTCFPFGQRRGGEVKHP